MKEIGSLVFAAGLAISGCSGCKKSPQTQCKVKLHNLDTDLGYDNIRNYCKDIEEAEAKKHCLQLREDVNRSFMSLCMTDKTHVPQNCTKKGSKWECKPVGLKAETGK